MGDQHRRPQLPNARKAIEAVAPEQAERAVMRPAHIAQPGEGCDENEGGARALRGELDRDGAAERLAEADETARRNPLGADGVVGGLCIAVDTRLRRLTFAPTVAAVVVREDPE